MDYCFYCSAVPLEDDGIDIEAFEKLIIGLKNNNAYEVPSHGFWSAFYLIPHFHNPTGRSLSLGAIQFLFHNLQCIFLNTNV